MKTPHPIILRRRVERHLPATLLSTVGLLGLLLPLWLDPWAALPFEPAKVLLVRWYTALLCLAAGLGMALFARFRRESWAKLRLASPAVAAGLGYAALVTLAGSFGLSPHLSFWGASDSHGIVTLWAQIALFLLVIVVVDGDGDRTQLVNWLLLGSMPLSLYGLVQAAGGDPLAWQSDSVSPVLSTLGRSNFLGAYLALLLPFHLAHVIRVWSQRPVRPGRRAGALLLLGLPALCLLLTLARAGWLAAVAGLLVFLWFLPERSRLPRLIHRSALLVGATAVLLLYFWLGEQVGHWRFVQPTSLSPGGQPEIPTVATAYTELRETSLARRWTIWRAAWSLIGQRPLLGYGPEMFVVVFNARYPPGSLYAGTDVLVDDPHNQLLEHLLATGLLGTAAWLWLLGTIAGQGMRGLAAQRGKGRLLTAASLGSLAAWLVQAQLNPDVVAVSMIFWVVAGLVVAGEGYRQPLLAQEVHGVAVTAEEIAKKIQG